MCTSRGGRTVPAGAVYMQHPLQPLYIAKSYMCTVSFVLTVVYKPNSKLKHPPSLLTFFPSPSLVVWVSLLVQNGLVCLCAVGLAFMFGLNLGICDNPSLPLFIFLSALVIFLGATANLATVANTIAIEKDWIVVIADKNKHTLAGLLTQASPHGPWHLSRHRATSHYCIPHVLSVQLYNVACTCHWTIGGWVTL